MTRVKYSFASLAVCLTVCFREYGQLFTPAEILEGSNRVYGQVMLRVPGLRSPFMSSLSVWDFRTWRDGRDEGTATAIQTSSRKGIIHQIVISYSCFC